jgi:hypothetical protein
VSRVWGNDPIVLAHARALLASAPEGRTAYLDADANDPDTILARAARTLDFSQPVLELLEPGIVPAHYWRPGPGGPDPARLLPDHAGVGRKR